MTENPLSPRRRFLDIVPEQPFAGLLFELGCALNRTAAQIAEANRNRAAARADEARSEGRPHTNPQPQNPHD